jgi:HlyD family secretion protein/epimerase transport system membrane fusion protein
MKAIPSQPRAYSVDGSLKKTLWVGVAVIAGFFGGLGGWAALAPLSGAAIAPGVISPDGERRAVQHLEGGIVQELLVHEGSAVEAGQPLVVLDPSASRASRDVLQKELRSTLAVRARLIAERDDVAEVAFPDELTAEDTGDETLSLIENQMALFHRRRDARLQKKKILREQINQLEQTITGLESQLTYQTRQITLLREEAAGIAPLVEKGLERKPRLLALQRTEADVSGSRAANMGNIAKSRQGISETMAQIEGVDTEYKQEVGNKMAEVEAALSGIREKLRAATHIVRRTTVVSPISGTIVMLKANTIGGVVAPGQTILEIVPRDEELLVDARIQPGDIDEVHADLPARVIMTGYNQRTTPQLIGRVRQVSADRLLDSRTGQPYYLARIELTADHVRSVASHIIMKPGMPADVMIITSERTLFDYLVEPLRASVRKSFRES